MDTSYGYAIEQVDGGYLAYFFGETVFFEEYTQAYSYIESMREEKI